MLTLVTPPASEPVTLDEAKTHLHVTFDDDDDYITALVTAARQKCESYLCRSFVSTAWLQTMDGFPGQYSRYSPAAGSPASRSFGFGLGPLYGYIPEQILAGAGVPIVIPHARLIAVQSITYLDATGSRVTLDPARYDVEAGDGGRITPAYGTIWPAARVYPGSVHVAFTAGYGATAADVPYPVKAAILLYVSQFYENRSAVVVGQGVTMAELPMGAKWLLAAEDWGVR